MHTPVLNRRRGPMQVRLRHPENAMLALVVLAIVAVVLLSERGNRWLAACLAAPPSEPAPVRPTELTVPAVDWPSVGALGKDYLQAYLRLDTSRSEGREDAAEWLHGILSSAGIESHILDGGSGNPAVLARLRGSGAARPVVLYSRMGTWAPDGSRWTVSPHAGQEQGGYLYGVGAISPKGDAVAHALTMLVLHRLELPLQRDIVLLAVADDGALADAQSEVGAALARLQPEFLLGPGGGGRQALQSGEVAWMVGAFSHGSMVVRMGPERSEEEALTASAGERLLRGVMGLQAWRPAIAASATNGEYFRRLTSRYPVGIRHILALPWFWSHLIAPRLEQTYGAGPLRDSAALLRLEPWPDDPLCPSALLQVRTVPGRSCEQVMCELEQQVAGLDLRLQLVSFEAGREAGWDSAVFGAVERALALEDPGAIALPTGGAPEVGRRLSVPGVACYGLTPFDLNAAELARALNGDERLAVAQLAPATQRMVRMIIELAGE